MRKFLLILIVLLPGCALIFPKPHDPVMFGYLVDTKIIVDKISCSDKTMDWSIADMQIDRLKIYSTLRNDPQADAVGKLQDALKKAKESVNPTFCDSVLKINRTRIDVIIDAWKGR